MYFWWNYLQNVWGALGMRQLVEGRLLRSNLTTSISPHKLANIKVDIPSFFVKSIDGVLNCS